MMMSTLDKVIYCIGTFRRAQQNLSLLDKIGWRSAEKIALFHHASCSGAPTISILLNLPVHIYRA
jgi:hypothetical protein